MKNGKGFFPGITFDDSLRKELARSSLQNRYIIPPFSVFDARQGYWQIRKGMWLAMGIKSEIGRGGNLLKDSEGGKHHNGGGLGETFGSGRPGDLAAGFKNKKKLRAIPGGETGSITTISPEQVGGSASGLAAQEQGSGTSIFDPVLCEIAYRWFCPEGGHVLDPFAGGSVRGIVAATLGRKYTGVDLSARQVESNREQANTITPDNHPEWVVGNSSRIRKIAPGSYDFIFSCPPYFDLEVYSDDPTDLSTMSNEDFLVSYRKIIRRSLSMLKDDRFACFVVGNSRGKDHNYTHLPHHTISAFEDCGAKLYNEAVLVTAVGSLPLRTRRQFDSARKLGRTHQSVLVFIKGDYHKAVKAITGVTPDEAQKDCNP